MALFVDGFVHRTYCKRSITMLTVKKHIADKLYAKFAALTAGNPAAAGISADDFATYLE